MQCSFRPVSFGTGFSKEIQSNIKLETPGEINTSESIADSIINKLINSELVYEKYKTVLSRYRDNEYFQKIVASNIFIPDFFDSIPRQENYARLDLDGEFMRARVIPTKENWLLAISRPGHLMEIDLPRIEKEHPGTQYDLLYGINAINEAYCDRENIIGDEKLADFWLKILGENPESMTDVQKVSKIVEIGDDKRKIALVEKKTKELAVTEPESIAFIRRKMDEYFKKVIKSQGIE